MTIAPTVPAVPVVRLAREEGEDVAQDPPGREDQDVDLGVAEDPEQVLPEDRIAAPAHRRRARDEELRAEVAIEQEQERRRAEHRDEERVQDRGEPDPPDRERQAHVRHPGRAQADDRRDVVHRAHRRGDAGDEDGGDDERLAHARHAHVRGERGVGGPARAGRAEIREERGQHEQLREQEGPERVHVEAREGHVARADHERDEQVPERADQHGRDGEEDHDEPVRGEDLLVRRRPDRARPAEEQLPQHRHRPVRERPLPADEHGEDAADQQEEQPRPEELLRDHLVVDGEDVPAPERGRRRVDRLRLLHEGLCGRHSFLHSHPQCASASSGS